jgi:hypothetical protein
MDALFAIVFSSVSVLLAHLLARGSLSKTQTGYEPVKWK